MNGWWLSALVPLGCWWRAGGDQSLRRYFSPQTRHRRNP